MRGVCIFTLRILACASLLSALPAASTAAVISGSSSGYGIFATSDFSLANFSVGPAPAGVSQTASPAYDVSSSDAFLLVQQSENSVATGAAQVGGLEAAASSDVDGSIGAKLTLGSAKVTDADLQLSTLPEDGAGQNILTLIASLDSTAATFGDFGSLFGAGFTTIDQLQLQIGPTVVDMSDYVGVNIAPNTIVDLAFLGITGATLVLNEQIQTGDGVSSVGLQVNGLRLTLDNSGDHGASGEVVLAHSESAMVAVPEPATMLLYLLGTAGVILAVRRQRRLRVPEV